MGKGVLCWIVDSSVDAFLNGNGYEKQHGAGCFLLGLLALNSVGGDEDRWGHTALL